MGDSSVLECKNKVNNNFFQKLKIRQLILLFLDIIVINLSAIFSLEILFDFAVPINKLEAFTSNFAIYTIVTIGILYTFKCYNSLWRYASVEEMISIFFAVILSTLTIYPMFRMINIELELSFYIINALLLMILTGGTRFSYRVIRRIKIRYGIDKQGLTKVLIIGGGRAGALAVKEMFFNPDIKKCPVAIIDDDPEKIGRRIHGVPIVGGTKDIQQIVKAKKIQEIVLAIPSLNKQNQKSIIDICKTTKCKLKTLPGMYELIDGSVDVKKIRDIEIEDLLGRDSIKVNLEEISGYINDQVIMVTGGGGSIGSELCRQISKFKPKCLIILDIYENNAYEIQQELRRAYRDSLKLEVIIASVRDKNRLEQIFDKYRPNVVFHAAAHKHVPLMEDSPGEAVKNNVFGTLNVAQMCDKYEVRKFVLISTDKAVNPTNIMGATKRMAEVIIQAINKHSKTDFVAVRFGNVLGSNGSVIPLFKEQIKNGGPVTVTHPDIIRYFMTIPEAVQLVVQAGAMATGGEIFVLDMGEPVRIADLAKDLIRLSGFEPEVDIRLEFSGLRPGEKLYEELLMDEEGLSETKHQKIFIGQPLVSDYNALLKELEILRKIVAAEDSELLEVIMRKLVPTYVCGRMIS